MASGSFWMLFRHYEHMITLVAQFFLVYALDAKYGTRHEESAVNERSSSIKTKLISIFMPAQITINEKRATMRLSELKMEFVIIIPCSLFQTN
jgi:hypothetical protein